MTARQQSRLSTSHTGHQPPRDSAAEVDGLRAFEMFCTPALSNRKSVNHRALVERARHHLRQTEVRRVTTTVGNIQTYSFVPQTEPTSSVLLVHGWTGEAAFMGAFGDFLRRRGFRAILMDMPAHGDSEGEQASLFDCAQAVLEVAEALAPVHFALGHSAGALAVLAAGEGHYPLTRRYPFEAYVLVSMPNEFSEETREFGAELGLEAAAQRAFEKHLEHLAGRNISNFTGAKLLAAAGRPALLLHSRDDTEVPFTCAETVLSSVPHATLTAFDGLGHRSILYAPPVVRAAAAFLSRPARS